MKGRRPYRNIDIYYDVNEWQTCPICGGKIKHPYIGQVTSEQLEEDSNCCIWMEVQDENDYTLGYHPICRNIHPYTLDEENHKYVHYDFCELANCWWDLSLEEKIEKAIIYVTGLYPEVKPEDVIINTNGDKITSISVAKPVVNMTLNMSINAEGNVTINRL